MTLNYHKRDQLNAILTVPIRVHWGVSFPFGFQIKWLLISFLLNQKVLFVFFSGHLKYTSGLTSPGWGEGTGKFRASPDQLFYIGEVAFFSPHQHITSSSNADLLNPKLRRASTSCKPAPIPTPTSGEIYVEKASSVSAIVNNWPHSVC